tara:strand:- start:5632 stop:6126 length:495 start_codon:yes stop_codon:yes gene_type:complete
MADAIFDGVNLYATLPSIGTFDVEKNLYSAWKEWIALSDNAKYPPAFDTTGGDTIGAGSTIAPYYFLRTDLGWKIKSPEEDGDVTIVGNMYPRVAGQTLFTAPSGNYTVLITQTLSSQATVSDASPLTAAEKTQLAYIADNMASFKQNSAILSRKPVLSFLKNL